MTSLTDSEEALRYHDATKHYPMRYARSLGYLDWENQPDPFRRFRGARRILLPLTAAAGSKDLTTACPVETGPRLDDLYGVNGARIPPEPLTAESLGRFFELSLGITAWKSFQSNKWALRANPSSGNLHPTEGYCLLPPVKGIGDAAGVYHYRSVDHALEERSSISVDAWTTAFSSVDRPSFYIGLTSILWREAWKYGERAFRYCQHDVGHAIAALRYAAARQGWNLRLLSIPSDAEVAAFLGLDRSAEFEGAEDEEPELLAWVGEGDPPHLTVDIAVDVLRRAPWTGKANLLSAQHAEWDAIDSVAKITKKPTTAPSTPWTTPVFLPPVPSEVQLSAEHIFRQRRSAVAFDGETGLSASKFFTILDRTLPRAGCAPFDALDTPPAVDLAIFVHRVDGLDSGFYWLSRNGAAHDKLRAAVRPSFEWTPVNHAPAHLPLFLLKRGDFRGFGRSICCDQEIASDGAFNLGMIAELESPLVSTGAWMYRRLFWETGVIGQVLYLESEAAGLRGTGIGCFFDDEMHGVLGLKTHQFHSLYHFAVGKPVDDPRLQTWPAYIEGARVLTPP